MKIKLNVIKIETREWNTRNAGLQRGKRLSCIDAEGTVEQFLQVNQPDDCQLKPGTIAEFTVTKIRQWQDGTTILEGTFASPATK